MAEVVPVVIGILESVTKELDRWIEKVGITYNVGNCKNNEESVGDVKKRSFC